MSAKDRVAKLEALTASTDFVVYDANSAILLTMSPEPGEEGPKFVLHCFLSVLRRCEEGDPLAIEVARKVARTSAGNRLHEFWNALLPNEPEAEEAKEPGLQ